MMKYHDEEWGMPVHDDKLLFEFLVLESAQKRVVNGVKRYNINLFYSA